MIEAQFSVNGEWINRKVDEKTSLLRFLRDDLGLVGPWTAAEKKSLLWLLLAIVLWATDSWHGLNPAVIAIGGGLLVTLPRVGVLKTQDARRINFLLIIFVGGALGMGEVLVKTKALDVLTDVLMRGIAPLMSGSVVSAAVLYWAGFLYHFLLASEISMLSTLLPVIIKYSVAHGYDPVAMAMICNFASAGKIFVYQSAVLMLGYAFGYFEAKDLLKVGVVLSLVEAVLLVLVVGLYWPMIGIVLKA